MYPTGKAGPVRSFQCAESNDRMAKPLGLVLFFAIAFALWSLVVGWKIALVCAAIVIAVWLVSWLVTRKWGRSNGR
jgi:hypothetical protein